MGVGNRLPCSRIRIEIVVHVNTIHIVTSHDVFSHLTDIVAVFWDTRIQDQQIVILKTGLWCTLGDMTGGQSFCGLRPGTIRIDPGMQFHPTLMAFVNHPLQGIPIGRRSLPLDTCKETAPRLQLTLVKGVALWTYLEDNHVYTIFLQLIELITQCLLHLHCTQTLELSVHTLYPCATHLTLLAHCWQSQQHCHNQHYNLLYHHHFTFISF